MKYFDGSIRRDRTYGYIITDTFHHVKINLIETAFTALPQNDDEYDVVDSITGTEKNLLMKRMKKVFFSKLEKKN